MQTYICEICGKEFQRRKRKNDACRCCSRECGFKLQRIEKAIRKSQKKKVIPKIKPITIRRCELCRRTYVAKSRRQKYCSNECSYNKHLDDEHVEAERKFVPVKKVCRWCGNEFITSFKNRGLYCSEICREAFEKKRKHELYNRRLRGKIVDHGININILIERYDGICQLCGKPVDINDKEKHAYGFVYGNLYPSIDHIIPLAKGGTHSWRNVQLAHRLCNSIKSDDLLETVDSRTRIPPSPH